MEHSISTLDVRPWRTAAIVAAGLAVLELVALVAAGVALLGRPVADGVRDAATEEAFGPVHGAAPTAQKRKPKKAGAPAGPTLARGETSVLVLNGNGVAGAAAAAAERVRASGHLVGEVGNATGGTRAASMVMYRPGHRPEGERLARDLRVPIVAPLDGFPVEQLMGAHLVLIVAD